METTNGNPELPKKKAKKRINHYNFMPVRWRGMGHELSIRVYGDTWRITNPFEEIDQAPWIMEVVIDQGIIASCTFPEHKSALKAAECWVATHGMLLFRQWANEIMGRHE